MGFFLLLEGSAHAVLGVQDLAGETLRHGPLGTGPGIADQPTQSKRLLTVGAHVHRDLIGRTADAARLGFDSGDKDEKETEEVRFSRIRDAVMADLKRTFRPEFLNRIDEIIVFHQLTQDNIVQIARRMLDVTAGRMAQQGITLEADDDAVAELAKDGFDPQYGARPLRRAIQNQVEDAVAEQMLEGNLQSGDTAHVRLKDGKVVIEK